MTASGRLFQTWAAATGKEQVYLREITHDSVCGVLRVINNSMSMLFKASETMLLLMYLLVCLECPSGFIDTSDSCYRVVNSNLPWSIASLRCQTLHPDAHLVAIGNEDEQRNVDDIIDHLDSKMIY